MDSRYLEPEIEPADAATMRRIQEEKLRPQVAHAYAEQPALPGEAGRRGRGTEQIKTLDDLVEAALYPTRGFVPEERPGGGPPWVRSSPSRFRSACVCTSLGDRGSNR